jgi:hypothetical protein
MIKSTRITRQRHAVSMEEIDAYRILVKALKWRDQLGYHVFNGTPVLIQILSKEDARVQTRTKWLRISSDGGFFGTR